MPVSAITKQTQLGKESTSGTGVAANKRMPNMKIMPGPKFQSNEYRGQGFKYISQTVMGYEQTDFKFEDAETFDELIYVLSSIGTVVTPTTVDTSGKLWTITPSSSNPDTPATYTIEHGDSTGGWKFAYGIFSDLTLHVSREEFKCSGSGFGQQWTTGITMTASPTITANIPIIPNQVSVYLDATFGALGTTKLTAAYDLEFTISGRFGPTKPINSALASHGGHVELPPKVQLKLKLGADTVSDALVTQIHAAGVAYVQVKAVSTVLAGSSTAFYTFILNVPFQIAEGGAFEDMAGVYVADWTANAFADATAGYAWNALVTSKLASL